MCKTLKTRDIWNVLLNMRPLENHVTKEEEVKEGEGEGEGEGKRQPVQICYIHTHKHVPLHFECE